MKTFSDPNNSIQRRIAKILNSPKNYRVKFGKKIIRLGKRNRKLSAFIVREGIKASERHELDLLSQIIKPGMTVLDIGAN